MMWLSRGRARLSAGTFCWLWLLIGVLSGAPIVGNDVSASETSLLTGQAPSAAVVTTLHATRSPKHTPGVELTLDEVKREPGRHGTRITYRLNTSGFPRDKTYRLEVSSLSLSKPVTWVSGIRSDESGSLTNGKSPKDELIELTKLSLAVEDYNDGEFYMVAAVSDDGAVYAADRVYPFPIAADDGGCRVWAELLGKNRKTFGIMGSGFSTNSPVKTASWEDDERDRREGVERVGPDGVFAALVTHRKSGGVGTFSATGDSCSVVLLYNFGGKAKGPR